MTRAVVVGISDYQDPQIPDLRFADRDAEAFANYLRSPAGGAVPETQIILLTNQNATAGNIIAALTWLVEDSRPGDRVIISFSGHGDVEQVTQSQWGYLLAHDAPPKVYPAGGHRAAAVLAGYHRHALGGRGAGFHHFRCLPRRETGRFVARRLEGEQWGGGRGCFSYHLLNFENLLRV